MRRHGEAAWESWAPRAAPGAARAAAAVSSRLRRSMVIADGSYHRSPERRTGLEPLALVDAEQQVEILHRRARRALAEVVEQGDEPRLAGRFVGEHEQPHAVGAVQRLGIKP